MAVFVLVHGSRHDGAAWEGVIRHLEAQGHKAFAPTAAGYAKGANKKVAHAKCTKFIVDFITSKALSDFVLVGQSCGGTYISKVAEAIPGKIRRLVFQNGFVVRDGQSVLDESPPATAALFEKLAGESEDHSFLLPFPVWREAFINDRDMETAKRTYALLSPEPLRPAKDKLDLKKVLLTGYPEQLYQLHRRHCFAARGVGLASPDVKPARASSSGPDAGKSRSDVHKSFRACGENCGSGARLAFARIERM